MIVQMPNLPKLITSLAKKALTAHDNPIPKGFRIQLDLQYRWWCTDPDGDNPEGQYSAFFNLMKPLITACLTANWVPPDRLPFDHKNKIGLLLDPLLNAIRNKPYLIIESKPVPSWLRLDIGSVAQYLRKLGIADGNDYQASDVLRVLNALRGTGLPCLKSLERLVRHIPGKNTAHYLVQYLRWIYRISMVLVTTADENALKPLSEDEKRPFVSTFGINRIPKDVLVALHDFVRSLYPNGTSPLTVTQLTAKKLRSFATDDVSAKWYDLILSIYTDSIESSLALTLPLDLVSHVVGMVVDAGFSDADLTWSENLGLYICTLVLPLMYNGRWWSVCLKSVIYPLFLLKAIVQIYASDYPELGLKTLFEELEAHLFNNEPLTNPNPLLQRAFDLKAEDAKAREDEQRRKDEHEEHKKTLLEFRVLSELITHVVYQETCNDGEFSYWSQCMRLYQNKNTTNPAHILTYLFALLGVPYVPSSIKDFRDLVLLPLSTALKTLSEPPASILALKSVVKLMMHPDTKVTDEALRTLVDPILGHSVFELFEARMAKARALFSLRDAPVVDLHHLLKRLLEAVFDEDTIVSVYAALRDPSAHAPAHEPKWVGALKEGLNSEELLDSNERFKTPPPNFVLALSYFVEDAPGNGIRNHIESLVAYLGSLNDRSLGFLVDQLNVTAEAVTNFVTVLKIFQRLDFRRNVSSSDWEDLVHIFGDEINAHVKGRRNTEAVFYLVKRQLDRLFGHLAVVG